MQINLSSPMGTQCCECIILASTTGCCKMAATRIDHNFAITNVKSDVQPAPSFYNNQLQISANIHVKLLKSMYLQEASKAQTMCSHADFL